MVTQIIIMTVATPGYNKKKYTGQINLFNTGLTVQSNLC